MNSYSQYKVLVLGVDDRSALTTVRSLGRRGITVHLGSDNPVSVAALSRYVNKTIVFPNAGNEPQEWVKKLEIQLEKENYDLVIPTVDKYLVPVIRNRQSLEKFARLAIPDERSFEYTFNKSKTFELAQELGLPCPKTVKIEKIEEIETALREFKFPVIVKPVSSKVWIDNIRHSLDVELAKDSAHLQQRLSKLLKLSPVLIQSYHKGTGVGQEFLTNKGEVVAAFQHDRVHEPLGGGGSSYRKSSDLLPELYQASLKLLKALRWTGVIMIEYKYDYKIKEGVLIETNGRFWGSLPLPVACGIDFPAWLFDMLVLNKTPQKVAYKKNIYCRNIVKDWDWFKANLSADKTNPLIMTVPLTKVFAEIRNWLLFRERFDTLTLDDPMPGINVIRKLIKDQVSGAFAKLHSALIKS